MQVGWVKIGAFSTNSWLYLDKKLGCLSARDHIFGTTRSIFSNFCAFVTMAVTPSSSGGVVICYVFPVLWMTSYLHNAHELRLLEVAAMLRQ